MEQYYRVGRLAKWAVRGMVGVVVGAQAGTYVHWMATHELSLRDLRAFSMYMVVMTVVGVCGLIAVDSWATRASFRALEEAWGERAEGGEQDAGVQCED